MNPGTPVTVRTKTGLEGVGTVMPPKPGMVEGHLVVLVPKWGGEFTFTLDQVKEI